MAGGAAGDRGDGPLPPVVSNTSPLIGLERIGRLDLLRDVYGDILVPPTVVAELGGRLPRTWVTERRPKGPIPARVRAARLDAGEREAIVLAIEVRARRLVLDDELARHLALALGLPVIGTVGVVLTARRMSLIAEVRPILDALLGSGFRIGREIYDQALADAGDAR